MSDDGAGARLFCNECNRLLSRTEEKYYERHPEDLVYLCGRCAEGRIA